MSFATSGAPRINGSVLAKFKGKKVVLLGNARNVDSNGMSFTLQTCDKHDIQVHLSEPLSEYVGGLTEVLGEVSSHNSINCNHYILFSKEQTDSFDMEMYNSTMEMINKFPQHYRIGVKETD